MQLDTATSEILSAPTSPEKLTLFPADFPASRFPSPGSDEAKTMTVRSGVKCFELYGQFAPLGSFAKTLLESSAWNSTRCLLTWKASATPAKRLLFRLVPSVPFTDETGFGLLPTPTSNPPGYSPQTELLDKNGAQPTHFNQRLFDAKSGRLVQKGLKQTVKRLLPTPTAQDAKNLTCPPSQKDRDSIPGFLISAQSNGSPIHPTFYERLMGYPEGWTDVPPE